MTSHDSERPFYILFIYLHDHSSDILKLYTDNVEKQQQLVKKYIDGFNVEIDSGFDIFTPKTTSLDNNSLSNQIPMGISTSMTFGDKNCGYYLYPRSSMGAKTPLRLSNSVGIIDPGYRGEITAIVDNISRPSFLEQIGSIEQSVLNIYTVSKGDRIVQICAPNLTYPVYPMIVDSIEDLGSSIRGINGLGSTGV